jgi:myo-inositol-1(or 4)-monophosphatase
MLAIDWSILHPMTTINLDEALSMARNAVKAAAQELKPHYGNIESQIKGNDASVSGVFTELDGKIERLLETGLGKLSPAIGFIGEEFGVRSEADTTWLVDPIDGTAAFIRGMPFCTIIVALVEKGEVVLGVIHDIVQDDTYWAIKGQGAYCNDDSISVSTRSLSGGIVGFETRLEKPENLEKYMQVRAKANTIETLGSGFTFATIAAGKIEGKIGLEPYGKDWDFAAGSLLVREAGGVATNIGKTTYDYKNHDFLITNATVHEELTKGPGAIFPV